MGAGPMDAWASRGLCTEPLLLYWKVDTAGNQLPYADRLVFNVIPNPEIILLKFANGELDLFGRHAGINMISTLRSQEKFGAFTLRVSIPGRVFGIFLNWDTPRLNLRNALRMKEVRVALSLALNREEISQIVFQGLMQPCGYSLSPHSPYYSDECYKRFSQFDPARALSGCAHDRARAQARAPAGRPLGCTSRRAWYRRG